MGRFETSRTSSSSLSLLATGVTTPVIRVSACSRPQGESGGDFYDLLPYDEEHLGVFIGDVSGHGPHVGEIGALTRDLMRQQARRYGVTDPSAMLASLNLSLFDHLPKHVFVTAIFGVLHRPSGAFRFVRAGHTPPLLVTEDRVEETRADGIALGLDRGTLFTSSLRAERLVFREGDRLLLFTDGLTEAEDASETQYGTERLERALTTYRSIDGEESFLTAILRDWRQHLDGQPPEDDVTVIGLHHTR